MDVKKEALENVINDAIQDLKHGRHDDEEFAIYEGDGVQVQVKVIKDDGYWFDEVLPDYAQAADDENTIAELEAKLDQCHEEMAALIESGIDLQEHYDPVRQLLGIEAITAQ
jgi:hypothetical protein